MLFAYTFRHFSFTSHIQESLDKILGGCALLKSWQNQSKVFKKRISLDGVSINQALRLPSPTSDFEKPTHDDLREILRTIWYSGDLALLGDIKRTKMSPIWSYYFDIIIRCFFGKIGGWDQIPLASLKIGYGIIMNKPIHIGESFLVN